MRKVDFFTLAIFLVYCLMAGPAMAKTNISIDQSSLFTLKAHLHIDHSHILSRNWSDSTPFCAWIGVTCGLRHKRVTALDISRMDLTGSLSPQLGNLSFLLYINISGNHFYGDLPQEFTRLRRLRIIDFGLNSFTGQIPSWFGFLPKLQVLSIRNNGFSGFIPPSLFNISSLQKLDLSINPLQGKIPKEIGNLYNLKAVGLQVNRLTGAIPLPIFNISTLEMLALTENSLFGDLPRDICRGLPRLRELHLSKNKLTGEIPSNLSECSQLQLLALSINKFSGLLPQQLWNLTKLRTLFLGDNKLTGVIPQLIGNLYNLEKLDLTINNFTGSMPSRIFNISTMKSIAISNNQLSGNLDGCISVYELPNLEVLDLSMNNFYGRIPNSIANSSKLIFISLSFNNFNGTIPNFLGDLRFLETIGLVDNKFITESAELSFITSFTNCRYLTKLGFGNNPLSGILPISVGNLSTSLQYLYGYNCDIQGSIPNEIGNLTGLILLSIGDNQLTGSIPSSMANLQKLQVLALLRNKISGSIPYSICELQNLYLLHLSENLITGDIPDCIGNITRLGNLHIYTNRLRSSIPTSLWLLNDLQELNLSSNFLSGSLPNEIRNLKTTEYVDLSVNQFSGSIPTTIGDLQNLISLSLAHNKLQGSIPESMGNMLNLEQLDLSYNNLSGNIPKSLEALKHLTYLNVSSNDLRGEIPSGGPFINFSSQSFMYNTGLCNNSIYSLQRCHGTGVGIQKRRKLMLLLIVISVIIVALTLAYTAVRYQRKKLADVIEDSTPGGTSRISYYELMQATEGYGQSHLLGTGSFGSVYRGTLNNGKDVAVKVFNLQQEDAFKSFDVECGVLRNIRHRNLCKVISTCSNPDFKALVLEYMSNGNLDKWLYSDEYFLDILQRINIMIDVACALEYLHYGYSTPIAHCDLKPCNILLNEEMVAHLSDFGIAKLLGEEESNAHTTTLGTLGYIAPEYGLEGLVSIRCDVYSYGIILMEVFTRIKPTSERFVGDLSLRSWINNSMPHEVTQIVDSNLLNHEEQRYTETLKCVSFVMELALNCSKENANERMNMKDVVIELKKIRSQLLA